MGTLAHYFEEEGISTIVVSLVREQAEKLRSPRSLWVPFELGRPLGVPDAAFQRRVLDAAFALLDAPAGPVLADYPEEQPDFDRGESGGEDGGEAWACPVNLPPPAAASADPAGMLPAVRREMAELAPWYQVAAEAHGGTKAVVSGLTPEQCAAFLADCLGERMPDSLPAGMPAGISMAEGIKHCVTDLMAFYYESGTAQPGARRPTSRQAADWFWTETAAGPMLRLLRERMLQSDDPAVKRTGAKQILPQAVEARLK